MSAPYHGVDNGVGYGLSGTSSSGNGVNGDSKRGVGVWGTCNNPDLGSIWGDSRTINVGAGVVGNSVNGYGLWGQSSTDTTRLEGGQPYANVGVFGLADRGQGVLGQTDLGAGISGLATNPQGFAGWFQGNVQVTGKIFKGGSNFRIDHPLDPKNKYLTHAAVESDQMKNLYDGVVRLNRKGEATVQLPRWFMSLNGDLRYQLTPIGAAAPDLHIAAELTGGKFRIAGGSSGLRVCWQVTGVRQDRWAKENPLDVESPKPRTDRGKYLHPKLYRKKDENGIGWTAILKPRVVPNPAQGGEEEG
jgi:hypothetical protein